MLIYPKKYRTVLILLMALLPLIGCAQSTGNKYPLDGSYTRFAELASILRRIDAKGESLVKLHLLGFSTNEDLPIHALEIGSAKAKRNVLIIGQHHGDEVLGLEVALAFAEALLGNGEHELRAKQILNQFRFWIIPTINPEGYRIVSSGAFAWKRKNNSDTDKNGKFDIRSDGVDLNRNYPAFWADDPTIQPESPYFKGFAPISESEVLAVINLAKRVKFEYAIFMHSSATGAYSEKLYLPWFDPHNENQVNAIEALRSFADYYASQLPKDYGKGYYEVHYGTNSRVGNARNYFFHTHKTQALLIEIGGINTHGNSVIHPRGKKMHEIKKKHLSALFTLFANYLEE